MFLKKYLKDWNEKLNEEKAMQEQEYGQPCRITDEDLSKVDKEILQEKEKAMQEQESIQELTDYYQNIFTLKNGIQIEICTKEKLELEHDYKKESSVKYPAWKIWGFVNKGSLLEEKEIIIRQDEMVAMEMTKKSCIAQIIPWPEDLTGTWPPETETGTPIVPDITALGSGLDEGVNLTQHPEDCDCLGCVPISSGTILDVEPLKIDTGAEAS